MDTDISKVASGAKKPAHGRPAIKKSAAKKQARTLYHVAIKNGWGPRLEGMTKAVAHLKKTPA